MILFYKTLKINLNADSETIRKAYLSLVKRHPPEKDPTGFKKISEAYEALKDEDARIYLEIGVDAKGRDKTTSPHEAATEYYRADVDPRPVTEENFFKFLES